MSRISIKGAGITRWWWIPLITGVLCTGFGIWSLCSPQTSLPVFAYIFAGCLCAAGLLNIAYACFTSTFGANWGWSLALGILDIVAGVWMFAMPAGELELTFLIVIGIWLLAAAINSVAESCMLSAVSPAWIAMMIVLLIVTLIFAVIFLSNPIVGGVAAWLWLGLSLTLFGVYRIILSFKIKAINKVTGGLV